MSFAFCRTAAKSTVPLPSDGAAALSVQPALLSRRRRCRKRPRHRRAAGRQRQQQDQRRQQRKPSSFSCRQDTPFPFVGYPVRRGLFSLRSRLFPLCKQLFSRRYTAGTRRTPGAAIRYPCARPQAPPRSRSARPRPPPRPRPSAPAVFDMQIQRGGGAGDKVQQVDPPPGIGRRLQTASDTAAGASRRQCRSRTGCRSRRPAATAITVITAAAPPLRRHTESAARTPPQPDHAHFLEKIRPAITPPTAPPSR